jgi:hypothetical protein
MGADGSWENAAIRQLLIDTAAEVFGEPLLFVHQPISLTLIRSGCHKRPLQQPQLLRISRSHDVQHPRPSPR